MSAQCQTLVKDGEWAVPEDQRPRDWRSMTLTKERIVVHERQQVAVERATPDEPVESKQIQRIPTGSTQKSFLPPAEQVFGDAALTVLRKLWGFQALDVGEAEWCDYLEDRTELVAESAERYEIAKLITDRMLNGWVVRHRKSLRHIGVGSKAIQDLWKTFHVAVLECLERNEVVKYTEHEEAKKQPKPEGGVQ